MKQELEEIELSLGVDLKIKIPKQSLPNLNIVEPNRLNTVSSKTLLTNALTKPIGAPLLEKVGRVAVVFGDYTRHPSPFLADLVVWLEKRASDLKLICAGGSHPPPTQEYYKRVLGENVYERYKGSIFASSTQSINSTYILLGKTSRGVDVEVNKELLDRDTIITTSNVQPHFFAGYSGGAKAILPGCSSLKTIVANHSLAIGNPNAKELILEGNPLREDMEEAAALLSKTVHRYHILDFVLNPDDSPVAAAYGSPLEAHRHLVEEYASKLYVVKTKPSKLVISVADWPTGRNLMQAFKAAWYASNIIDEQGDIKPIVILVAALVDGVGNPSFRDEITRYAGWSPEKVFEDLKRRAKEGSLTETSQGPNRLAIDRQRFTLKVVSPSAPREVVSTLSEAGYTCYRSITEALNDMPFKVDKIIATLLPHGSLTVPLPTVNC
ncbi:MAG: lactate racemase domain-containing protein [Nitrososphaerales archaeon]